MDYRPVMSSTHWWLKRGADIFCSLICMLVFSPLFLVIYIAVKSERSGPAFFRQTRIGYQGRPFEICKFRTMYQNSEEDGVPQLCRDNDERLTKVGKFLREHHLDELPQLWNVLKGDMSLVGPRPERKYFIDQIMKVNPDYRYLFQIRPGVFSYATLRNGYTDTLEKMLERLRMDLEYLKRPSLFGDLKIVVLTALFIVSGRKF